MASYKDRGDYYGGYFETLKNISKQQAGAKGPRTSMEGVESLTAGEEAAKDRAAATKASVTNTAFQAPQADIPDVAPPDITAVDNVNALVGQAKKGELTGGAESAVQKAGGEMQGRVQSTSEDRRKAIQKAIDNLSEAGGKARSKAEDFIDKAMSRPAATGEVGQESQVEQQDRELAEAMTDPTMRTSDIAALAASYRNYDPRLGRIQGEALAPDMAVLRGEALRQLSQYGAAQGATDAAVGELAPAEEEARTRIGEQAQEFENTLTDQSAAALKSLSDWETRNVQNIEEATSPEAAAKIQGVQNEAVAQEQDKKGYQLLKDELPGILSSVNYGNQGVDIEGFMQLTDKSLSRRGVVNQTLNPTDLRVVTELYSRREGLPRKIRNWVEGKIAAHNNSLPEGLIDVGSGPIINTSDIVRL